MSAIFQLPRDPKNPVRLVNVRTLGAMCGRFESYEAAEEYLRQAGYQDGDFWREQGAVCFVGPINC